MENDSSQDHLVRRSHTRSRQEFELVRDKRVELTIKTLMRQFQIPHVRFSWGPDSNQFKDSSKKTRCSGVSLWPFSQRLHLTLPNTKGNC